jgi:hypothetical protein
MESTPCSHGMFPNDRTASCKLQRGFGAGVLGLQTLKPEVRYLQVPKFDNGAPSHQDGMQ